MGGLAAMHVSDFCVPSERGEGQYHRNKGKRWGAVPGVGGQKLGDPVQELAVRI